MSDPSDKAVEAASVDENVYWEDYDSLDVKGTAGAMLAAAHDPALGLDRSVCLRDVVEALHRHRELGSDYEANPDALLPAATFIEREFGGKS